MSRSGHPLPAPAPPLRAVTFDMDGLLVDSEPLWFQAESAVMERLHGAWSRDDQDVLVGGSMATTVAYLLSKGTRPAEPADVARWLLEGMIGLLTAGPVPVLPGAVELVDEVRTAGLPYALVTSSEPEVVDAVLAGLDVEFPVIVCAADVAHAKPDPEGYLLAAAKLGAEPGQCIALEDSVNGVTAAEAAGFRTVAVPSVVPVPERPGRVVVESLAGMTLAELAARAGFAI
jgi:HAD superfamily hydrolase (TIGR01509 family)